MRRVFSIIVCLGTSGLFVVAIDWVWQMACLARESTAAVVAARVRMENASSGVLESLAKWNRMEKMLTEWVGGKANGIVDVAASLGSNRSPEKRTEAVEADSRIENLLSKLWNSELKWASAEGEKPLPMLYGILIRNDEAVGGKFR